MVSEDKKRILVLDDEPMMADFVKLALSRAGHLVDHVFDGDAGLAMIRQRDYDAILTDVCMPGLNGMEFYQVLEKEKPHLVERVIFMTGAMLEQDIEDFIANSHAFVLQKPFYLNQLMESLNSVLAGSE